MAQQLACVFSTVQKVGNEWQPKFVELIDYAADEKASGAIDEAPDGTLIPFAKDFVPGGDDLVTAAGFTLAYVYADEARVTAADGNSNYLVLWRMYTEPPYTTSQMPGANMTSGELIAIRDYLADNSVYTATQIINWLINKFEVSTQQQAVNWATSRPRTATVQKLMQAMSIWQTAKTELDAL